MKTTIVKLPFAVRKPILALGSQAKNTVCFAHGRTAILSPVHADLDGLADFLGFERQVKKFLLQHPAVIAYDAHPEYRSTQYLQQLGGRRFKAIAVQHHHAHVASCMAENNISGSKVIGVVFDGTGWGLDNTGWGAEFLVCRGYRSFARQAHLRNIPLIGASAAIREPARLAAAWLSAAYGEKFRQLKIPLVRRIPRGRWMLWQKMSESGFNSPLVSSMGRLFDAVASIVLAQSQARFEAALAVTLQKVAESYRGLGKAYRFAVKEDNGAQIIDPAPMVIDIVQAIGRGAYPAEIAFRFHVTVAEMIHKTCCSIQKLTGINKVALSGGVFQNSLLLSLTLNLLYRENFKVITHRRLPCNDACVSLGQAAVANFNIKNRRRCQ